jgi:hypothetical protein
LNRRRAAKFNILKVVASHRWGPYFLFVSLARVLVKKPAATWTKEDSVGDFFPVRGAAYGPLRHLLICLRQTEACESSAAPAR